MIIGFFMANTRCKNRIFVFRGEFLKTMSYMLLYRLPVFSNHITELALLNRASVAKASKKEKKFFFVWKIFIRGNIFLVGRGPNQPPSKSNLTYFVCRSENSTNRLHKEWQTHWTRFHIVTFAIIHNRKCSFFPY